MPRSIWTGAISFGLVNIPVRLYSATQSHRISFHQFQRKTGQRIRYKRVAEGNGREVPFEEIVKGYEVKKGKFVMLEPEELEAVEPKKTKSIDIEDFVDINDIDPIVWADTYFIGPDESPASGRAYALLWKAMTDMGKVGIGRFVMREKEYLTTIRPLGKGLALETMYFADEVRDQAEVPDMPAKVEVAKKELDLAKQLITSLAGSWEHARYKDTYRERVMELIDRKAKGEEITTEAPAAEEAQVVDLMEALKQSLSAGGSKREAPPRASARSASTARGTSRSTARSRGKTEGSDGRTTAPKRGGRRAGAK